MGYFGREGQFAKIELLKQKDKNVRKLVFFNIIKRIFRKETLTSKLYFAKVDPNNFLSDL